jgi:hypothetical protein
MAKKQQSDASASQREEDAEFLEAHREGLSRSTQRAKWISSVDEHEDRPGQTLATRAHDVICRWAEERGAQPATVASGEETGSPRVLRLNFPGFDEGGNLREITWDEWFRPFDERQLVFLYQEHRANGEPSNFFRLDNPEREDA